MPPTAEDHYRSLPPADQAVVLRMRRTLQKDGYEALDDHEARSTRQRFQRTLNDDKGQSPLQRQLALELLSRKKVSAVPSGGADSRRDDRWVVAQSGQHTRMAVQLLPLGSHVQAVSQSAEAEFHPLHRS